MISSTSKLEQRRFFGIEEWHNEEATSKGHQPGFDFGKHCPRIESKRNAAAAAILSRSEQLDTREPSRLQSSLDRILRKREKMGDEEGTGQRQRRERDGRARACTMENQKFEPMHREAHLRQQDAARSCPADSFTTPEKEMIKKGQWWGEKERDNQ